MVLSQYFMIYICVFGPASIQRIKQKGTNESISMSTNSFAQARINQRAPAYWHS